jgi:hypothetical protein
VTFSGVNKPDASAFINAGFRSFNNPRKNPMAYSLLPGRLKSHLTGREYHFERDRDGSSRRMATRQLETDDRAVTEAANARAIQTIGRSLTMRELQSGGWVPDTRPTSQQVAEDATHISQSPYDPDENPFVGHLESLRAKQAHDKSPTLAKRIEMFQAKSDEWERIRSGEREHQAKLSNPDVAYWLADANACIALLEVRGDVSQEWIDKAKARRDQLKATGDYTSYKRDMLAFESEYKAAREAKAKGLDDAAKELRAEAKAVRQDAPAEYTIAPLVQFDRVEGRSPA